MTSEEVARAHERFTGFDLVDYSDIALPLWQLSIEALSLAHRRFQPIIEFVLRGLNANLTIEEVSGFLGLELEVVKGAASQLIADRLVTRVDSDYALSEAGRKALQEEGLQAPIEEQLSVLFDGLLRKPAVSEPEQTVMPRELEDGAVIEIPSIPASRPSLPELLLPDVVNYLSSQSGGRREMGRDILSLKRIARYRRIYRRGVGLVFKAKIGRELRVVFVVDGTIDEQLQNQFAAAGGTLRPGFVRAFSDSYLAANLRRHLGQEASRIKFDLTEYQKAQQRVSIAKLRRATLARKSKLVSGGKLATREMPSEQALSQAEKEEQEATEALRQIPVRPAAVYEAAEFLSVAFAKAQSRISISSRGLAPHIVDNRLWRSLTSAAARGVQITISLHEASFEWPKRGSQWARTYAQINQLTRDYPQSFRVKRTREDRFFHLAWDGTTAMICNRPFLSNQGRIKGFEQFAGYVLQRAELVDAYLDRATKALEK